MSLNLNIPIVIGGASSLIGYGLAYLLYKKFISNKYGKGKVNANSVYYWCGLIAMIAVGTGLGTLINEGLSFFTISSSINGDAVARGIVTLIFYPSVLAIIAILISKFSSKLKKSIDNQSDIDAQIPSNSSNNPIIFSKNKIYLVFTFFVIVSGVLFFYNGNFSLAKEKKFDVVQCELCMWLATTQKFDCDSNGSNLRHIIIGPEKIQLIALNNDQSIQAIIEKPDSETKCIISLNSKFSFACSSSSFDTQLSQKFERSLKFDGSTTYESNSKAYFLVNGIFKPYNHNKLTCTMKG
jgi:hypothetical protein